jgi:YD repeat-containing protein
MAIYTVENTSKIGKPCKVYDARGDEITDIIECNDETGFVVRYARDEQGKLKVSSLRQEIRRFEEMRPLPFRIEWKGI